MNPKSLSQENGRKAQEKYTEVQPISLAYFASMGATLVWDEWANWVATIPIPLPLRLICYDYLMLAQHTLLVKYTKLKEGFWS